MGVIFLTLFLDLAGFSIIFPLSPKLLEHYLAQEGREGLLGAMTGLLESVRPMAETSSVFNAALFGGVLGSIYSLLQFLFAPFWGSISDRTGRKPILLLSNSGIAASYLLWALSGNFSVFILSRFLAGAMGGNISVATAAAADSSSREDRAKAMGIVGAAFGLGFIFGPVIGGSLSLGPIREWFASMGTHRVGPFALNPFSGAALGAFALSLTSVFWVATRFEETLKPEARGLHREPRTINPARFFQRYEYPGVRAANIITFIYLLAFSAMEFTLTFFAEHRFGYGPTDNIAIFVFVGVIMALVQGGLVRRIAPRLGERRMAALGLALVVPGLALIGAAPAGHSGVMYLGLLLTAVGSGLVTPATTSLVSLYTPPERQGGVLGIFRSLGSFARGLGPILGALLFWGAHPAAPYFAAALLVAPTAVLALKLPEPAHPERAGK